MELNISVEFLKENKLSLGQYVYMWTLFNQLKDPYIVSLSMYEYIKLLALGLVYRVDDKTFDLTDKGFDLFNKDDSLFSIFINEFPTRVMGKGAPRSLSPASPDTLGAEKIRKKWNSVTRRNSDLQRKIINCLKKEVEIRQRSNDLYWMRNAETWLNKCTWEDYEYLLDEETKVNNTGVKTNEIRL